MATTPLRRTRILLLLAVLSAALAACAKKLESGAGDEFTRRYSCPKNRVEVRARKDLPSSTLQGMLRSSPPADVAGNPARLAIWRKQNQSVVAFYNDRFETFEARGCDRHVLLVCAHPNGSSRQVSCNVHDLPAAAEKSW